MKTLPDNPNLDHLRQQAKDLLAGLRDTEPTTSLADAQASLAEQYGFRGWTELKAEVDRRRGQAEVAEPALARAIAHRFRLGEVAGPMRSVARPDHTGRRWTLETERGRWAVRTMDGWYPIVDAETEVALQSAAAGAGIRLPAAVRSRSGAIVESIGGHTWRVDEWLHSGPPLAAPASASITHEVGEILARIHRLALPVDRISPWHVSRLSPVPWSDLAATAIARGTPWAAALSTMVPRLVELETLAAGNGGHTDLPAPVLSHNSLIPGNVRRERNGRLIVLGWEYAGGQPPNWELGEVLKHWTIRPDGGINAAGAQAMVAGYRTTAGSLPPLELTMFAGAVIGLANYVSGEIDRALHPRDREDQRHADRSVQHLLAHLPSRTSLEQLLETVRAAAPVP